MRILVKIGGAGVEQPEPRQQFAQSVASARRDGHEVVVVHGGGNQIRDLTTALGLPERYHQGLRITDARTAEVALMVLGGSVNRTLVAALQAAGATAVGLCGADGGTFLAEPLARPGIELGFVGQIAAIDPRLVRSLLAASHVPVIATVAPRRAAAAAEPFYNLNADHAAGQLAHAFGCDAVLFLTDVPGVRGAGGAVLRRVTPGDCARLAASGMASGGMLPKLEAACAALAHHPGALIKIAPATGADAVRSALRGGVGTCFAAAATQEAGDG